jgi:hypothetical protein
MHLSRKSSETTAAMALGVQGRRITSLTDALLSIIATITAVPLAASVAENRKGQTSQSSVQDALTSSALPLFYCLLTFNIISKVHLFHCVIFQNVQRASVLVVLANTIFLFFVSLLPMAYTLLADASLGYVDPDAEDPNTNLHNGDLSGYRGPAIFLLIVLSLVRYSGALLVFLLPLRSTENDLMLRRKRLYQELLGGIFFSILAPLPEAGGACQWYLLCFCYW